MYMCFSGSDCVVAECIYTSQAATMIAVSDVTTSAVVAADGRGSDIPTSAVGAADLYIYTYLLFLLQLW